MNGDHAAPQGSFKSRDFAVSAQKKILGKIATRKSVKMLVNDNLSHLLDLLYQLIKSHTGDKKVAEKFVKNIIKLSIKFSILAQNEVFSSQELKVANEFACKFDRILKSITSFVELDYSYDRKFLLKSIDDCESQVKSLVKPHLTEKSILRIESVSNHLRDPVLLDNTFKRGTPQNEIMQKIVVEINKAFENGDMG